MSIKNRLERVNYQLMKDSTRNPSKTWSDDELIEKIRSIYDAAINPGIEPEISDAELPVEIFGAEIEWSPDNTKIVVNKGTTSVSDDLLDTYEEPTVDTTNALEVNTEMFTLSGSTYQDEFLVLSA